MLRQLSYWKQIDLFLIELGGMANIKDGLGQFDIVDASDLTTFGWGVLDE
jgi:hypothetical protein